MGVSLPACLYVTHPHRKPITIVYSSTYPTGYNIKGYPRAQCDSPLVLFATSNCGGSSLAALPLQTTHLCDRSIDKFTARLPLLDTQICSTLPPISLFRSSNIMAVVVVDLKWLFCIFSCRFFLLWLYRVGYQSATHIAMCSSVKVRYLSSSS